MAAKNKTITVTDFVPRAFHLIQIGANWGLSVVGDEVDAQGNIVNSSVSVGLDPTTLNAWNNFYNQALKAGKVKRNLDDGT